MRAFKAPHYYRSSDLPKLFLAGGITGCPDWQALAVQHLHKLERGLGLDITIFNPRQVDFDITDPRATEEQIRWEPYDPRDGRRP